MSKTYGHNRALDEHAGMKYNPDSWLLKENKSKPYLAEKDKGKRKILPEKGEGTGISRMGKLIAKNANRSLKKGKRQENKRMILDALEEDE